MTKMSAGPPIRSEVWKPSGSLNRTSPRISPSICPPRRERSTLALSAPGFESGQKLGTDLAHVARSQREHQIAAPTDVGEVLDDAGVVIADVGHVAMRVGPNTLHEIGGRHAGDGRFARRIDVHHEQHVRLIEGGEEF